MFHQKQIFILILILSLSINSTEPLITNDAFNKLDAYERDYALHFLPHGKIYKLCYTERHNYSPGYYPDDCTILALCLITVHKAMLTQKELPLISKEIETITQEINVYNKQLDTVDVFEKARIKNYRRQKQDQLNHLNARKTEFEKYKKQDPDCLFQNFPDNGVSNDIAIFETALDNLIDRLNKTEIKQEIKNIEIAFSNARNNKQESSFQKLSHFRCNQ